jgi:predicted transcriptional regulator
VAEFMKKSKPLVKFVNMECSLLDEESMEKNAALCKALSSNIRLKILGLIKSQGRSISEIAKKLYITVSSATFHLKILEDAGLVDITLKPGQKSSVHMCCLKTQSILLSFSEKDYSGDVNSAVLSIPVGHYVNAKFDFFSSFCTKNAQILFKGDAYQPRRMEAELLWCRNGFVEYAFSNTFQDKKISALIFSLEICSEADGYKNDWKSDITFSLNGAELLTWTSPGDFGDRRGLLNPKWWSSSSTQYGHLKKISVEHGGIYLDGSLVTSEVKLCDFNILSQDRLLFRIENKEDAEYKGGFNIFGKAFGDYPQDITLTILYEAENQ